MDLSPYTRKPNTAYLYNLVCGACTHAARNLQIGPNRRRYVRTCTNQIMSKSELRPFEMAKLVEETSDEEFKQLLASLPKQKGFFFPLYQFHGFWYTPQYLQGVLNCQAHFRALHSDILLVTTPKSGTTWLKALLFTLVNRPLNAPHPLTNHNPHDLVPFLEVELYGGDHRAPHLPSPRLFSTHMPASALPSTIRGSRCKIVYLCRDPHDLFISLWLFINTLGGDGDLPIEEAFETFCKGSSPYGPFWDHVLGYWKESVEMPSRVLFLKYEDVKGDTSSCLTRLAEFLGCPFSDEEHERGVVDRIVELCSFEHLSKLEVNKRGMHSPTGVEYKAFFRRGQVGDSLNYLTPEMSLRLDTIVKEKLHAFGCNLF